MFTLLTNATAAFDITAPLVTAVVDRLFRITMDQAIVGVVVLLVAYIMCACSLLRKFGNVDGLTGVYVCVFFNLVTFILLFNKRAQCVVRANFSSLNQVVRGFISLSAFASPLHASGFPRG